MLEVISFKSYHVYLYPNNSKLKECHTSAATVDFQFEAIDKFTRVYFCRSGATGCCATALFGILRRLARTTESGKFPKLNKRNETNVQANSSRAVVLCV